MDLRLSRSDVSRAQPTFADDVVTMIHGVFPRASAAEKALCQDVLHALGSDRDVIRALERLAAFCPWMREDVHAVLLRQWSTSEIESLARGEAQ